MCGIVASFDKNKFNELMKLNSYRGNFSYSIMCFDYIKKEVKSLYKMFGEYDENILNKFDFENVYYIGHQQAPTGGLTKDQNRIHPSEIDNSFLYHNGMLKNSFLLKYDWEKEWDTKLLHKLVLEDINNLDKIEGSFSCLYINNDEIKLFRNQLSPLYIDIDLNISSAKFENSKSTKENVIYNIDFKSKEIKIVSEFNNCENIYFL